MHELIGRFRAIDEYPPDKAKVEALALRDALGKMGEVPDYIRKDLLPILRDHVGWEAVVEYVDSLPSPLRDDREMQEQRLLALSDSGEPEQAIGALEQLIATHGPTAERCACSGDGRNGCGGAIATNATTRWRGAS